MSRYNNPTAEARRFQRWHHYYEQVAKKKLCQKPLDDPKHPFTVFRCRSLLLICKLEVKLPVMRGVEKRLSEFRSCQSDMEFSLFYMKYSNYLEVAEEIYGICDYSMKPYVTALFVSTYLKFTKGFGTKPDLKILDVGRNQDLLCVLPGIEKLLLSNSFDASTFEAALDEAMHEHMIHR